MHAVANGLQVTRNECQMGAKRGASGTTTALMATRG